MGESKTVFRKIGTLKVKNGTYKKDGVERNSYHEVGVLLSSPHGSRLLVKLHATASSESKLISVFYDEGVSLSLTRSDEKDKDADLNDDEIPF